MIHVLLMKSDLLVSQIVMKLLCKQNPVPFIALSSEKQNTSLIIPDIVHIWNYSLPTILSFGIGSCSGKSSLINNLFMTKFEHTVNSLYFRQTIDIDFGYNCQPRRPLNIADAHGELNKTLLQKIHRLFDGFIIQIDGSFFEQRSESLFEVLDILPEDKYCFVIVHDINHSSHNVYQNILQKQGQNRLKNIEIIIMQKISAHNDEQYEIDIQSLRNTIFRHRLCAVSNSPDFLKAELQKLITTDAIYHLENINKIIEPLVNELIQAGQCTDNVEKYFPVYNKFVEICSLRQKLAAVKFYEAINDDSIYSIRQSLYLLEESLHHIGKNQSGSIFDYFIDILKSTNILLVLNFLDNELRHQRNRLIPISDMAGHISIEKSFKLEVLWRNAIICYPYRPLDDQLLLIETYSKYIMAGYPFELIDGDNFYFASDFLLKTLSVFENKRILVISIIGPQNSGKSTLFNNMFGTSFDIDDGRCTRGIYGCFVKLNRPDFDYILLIDSEGLLSTERADKEFDHRIVLFCLTLSHLVIINTIGEIYQPINDILTYCAETMKMIGVSRLSQPKVHFVLNRKTDLNIERNSIAIKKIMKMLTDLKLESIIDMKANMFHALSSAFKQDYMSDELEMFTVNRTEPRFIKCVQQLRETIINSGINSISYTQEQLVDPVQWLRFAVEIFDTLQKFTDLIHFRDIHERRQHYEVRERIQMKLADLFSFDQKDNLIETIIKGNENQIEIILQNEEANISKIMNDEIENTFRYLKISEPIRQTSREFLIVEIKQMFIALKTSVIMSYEENKIKQLIHNGENDLRKLIEYTIKSGEKIIHTDRLLQFESMFNNIIGQIQRKFESLDCLRQTFYFIYTNYNIYESDFLPNYLYVYNVHFQPLEQLIECKLVTNKVKEFIENQSIIHAYKHSRIEEQEFKSNESNLYSLTLIENLKYLNKNQLLVLFNNFDPQPTSTDKHQSFTSDSILHQDFDRQYMNTSGNRIDDYSFQMKIRRIIINENLLTDFNQLNTDNREIFQISNCFHLLTQKIFNLSHQRSIDTNLIQRIVGFLNSTIKEINLELTPFYLVISRHFKSILHIYAILLLTELYYEEQERHFQQTIQALDKRKQDLYEFFHAVIVDDPSNDRKCAINLARQLKQQLLDEFSTTAQRIINSKMRKYEHINRQWIQEQCDKKLLMNDTAWNIDYIKNPDRIIEEYFYEIWETIQNQINEALINQKMVYASIFLDFFKMIIKIFKAMTTTDEIRITFINRHFQSDLNNTLSPEEDLNNKRCCMAQVLYAYLSGHNIPTDYYVLDKKYVLLSDMHTFFSKLAEQIPPSCQLMNTTKAMRLIYDSIRIDNLITFIEELLQQKDRFLNEFYQEPGNFTDLDKQNTYARLFDKVQGCQERCPSCGRPCDVDHTLIKSKPGSRGNRHCCISGHALLGMNGYCSGNTNQPLLITCDYNDPEQEVIIGATRQNWSDFVTTHADWDFNSVKSTDELTRSHGKWLTVWNKIGPELCREYRINFVPINTSHSIENHSFQGAW